MIFSHIKGGFSLLQDLKLDLHIDPLLISLGATIDLYRLE